MRTYREECQNNDAARSELELMQEIRKLRQELEESKKENEFLDCDDSFAIVFVSGDKIDASVSERE